MERTHSSRSLSFEVPRTFQQADRDHVQEVEKTLNDLENALKRLEDRGRP